jgi:hypothetical protein
VLDAPLAPPALIRLGEVGMNRLDISGREMLERQSTSRLRQGRDAGGARPTSGYYTEDSAGGFEGA